MNIIQTSSLSLKLDNREILRSISCCFPWNQTTAILGPNGAGKTMLLRCLAGLEVRHRGNVVWKVTNPIQSIELNRAWVPLSQKITFDFTVRELLLMGRYPHHKGYPREEDENLATEALVMLNIEALTDRTYNSLSRGEQTKVDIARAIAQGTSVIFLDEPFANLDIDAKLQIYEIFNKLRSEGKTIILTHHELHSIPRFANHIIYLKDGRLIAEGSLEIMFNEHWIEQVYNVKVKLQQISDTKDYAIGFLDSK